MRVGYLRPMPIEECSGDVVGSSANCQRNQFVFPGDLTTSSWHVHRANLWLPPGDVGGQVKRRPPNGQT